MKAVSVMLKPSSSACNMKCKYCFYNSLAAQRKDFSYGEMSEETAFNAINKAYQYADGGCVSIVFQGGEPLLRGIEFYRSFFKEAERVCGDKVFFSLQTNGTLIDDNYAELFRKHRVLVGLSLDGSKDYNAYRVNAAGEETFKQAFRAASIMKNHKVQFSIVSVVTKESGRHIIDIYNYFKAKGLKAMQFIPCLKPLDGAPCDESMYMDSEDYYDFLTKLFHVNIEDHKAGNFVYVRNIQNYIDLMIKGHAEQCSMNGSCSEQFVIEGDGSIFPCDFYCVDEFYLGNINDCGFDDAANSTGREAFMKNSSVITEECRRCPHVRLCRGAGCRRFKADGDMCRVYKRFFGEITKELESFLRQGTIK